MKGTLSEPPSSPSTLPSLSPSSLQQPPSTSQQLLHEAELEADASASVSYPYLSSSRHPDSQQPISHLSSHAIAPTSMRHPPAAPTPPQRWAASASDSQFNAIAGAVGGFTSGVVTCPLDVIKTKLQAQGTYKFVGADRHVGQPKLYNGLVGTSKVIWRQEGIRGMYRGLGPIVLGYLPTWAVWFTVYNKSKGWMGRYSDNTYVVSLWSSIVAGASSTIVTNPIWVIKTRLMSQSHLPEAEHHLATMFPKTGNTPTTRPLPQVPWHYRSTLDAARKMYTSEGLASFYSGLTPALLGLTHVAVQFPTYEFLKTTFTGQGMGEAPAEGEKAHWMGILSASVLSKILASSATYPHEVIRTRLQTQRRPVAGEDFLQGMGVAAGEPAVAGAGSGAGAGAGAGQDGRKYRGIITTFRTILREEGWRAFYAGLGTNMMRAVPAATVTMLTYEYVMRQLNRAKADGREQIEALGEASGS